MVTELHARKDENISSKLVYTPHPDGLEFYICGYTTIGYRTDTVRYFEKDPSDHDEIEKCIKDYLIQNKEHIIVRILIDLALPLTYREKALADTFIQIMGEK